MAPGFTGIQSVMIVPILRTLFTLVRRKFLNMLEILFKPKVFCVISFKIPTVWNRVNEVIYYKIKALVIEDSVATPRQYL